MKVIRNIIIHTTFILALCFIVLWIFDYYNPLMELMNNRISGKVLLLFFLTAMGLSLYDMRISYQDGSCHAFKKYLQDKDSRK